MTIYIDNIKGVNMSLLHALHLDSVEMDTVAGAFCFFFISFTTLSFPLNTCFLLFAPVSCETSASSELTPHVTMGEEKVIENICFDISWLLRADK